MYRKVWSLLIQGCDGDRLLKSLTVIRRPPSPGTPTSVTTPADRRLAAANRSCTTDFAFDLQEATATTIWQDRAPFKFAPSISGDHQMYRSCKQSAPGCSYMSLLNPSSIVQSNGRLVQIGRSTLRNERHRHSFKYPGLITLINRSGTINRSPATICVSLRRFTMYSKLKVVNDTIWATGTGVDEYTHREVNVRNAMFILTCIMPVVAAAFAFFGTPHWSRRFTLFSFSKIVSLWFLSIGVNGIALFYLPGQAPRILFIWAILHGQIEVVLNMLLLGFKGPQALTAAWVFGLMQYGMTLSVKFPITVFVIATIVGGGGAKGDWQQISAVTVFTGIGVNIGVVQWNVITFFGLWGHIFFMLRYILAGPIVIKDPTVPEAELEYEDQPNNPLQHFHFSGALIAKLIGFGLVNSTVVTLLIVFVL
ncbi:hypothetical protein FRB95_003267 [Tulasnella sp. JGI-2019a]|nr:hypothetical protein FRB95_003267 [Tulasnella sp. JGI-2019a]